ncbi:MAG TPA: RNA polymerase sporulation sigma factor SigH, partial [Firmicutes bacterium]|nr:RNA polymerase sporulation sigma factor SigH [Bacillota bacterium]
MSVNAHKRCCHMYESLSDEEIVQLARDTDDEALEHLINKYKNFVRAKARSYFLIGADREDIIQEGMIGLYKAIRDFRPDKLASFRAFAELCITRQIITAIKTATRQKHIPLNSYVSLNKPIYDEESDRTLLDVISGSKVTDPEELVISREEFSDIETKMVEF